MRGHVLASGTQLGPYEILAPIGAGGMGEVYRARDNKLGRTVALKLLGREYSASPDRLGRFEQEARSASALNHPNIVTIFDVGESPHGSYIAMEYVDGRTLRDLLGGGPLPLKKALGIAAQAAEGLAKAHAAGLVHRDLKPDNIMLSGDGVVKLLDFGLAKLVTASVEPHATATAVMPATNPGVVLGTVGYMSPEQARGAQVDFRSDQFSLGTVVYEMLTGRRAFQRESSAQTMAAIIEDDPPPVSEINPKVPPPVRWVVERCLAKEPQERYASTLDLARDLRNVRDHLSEASSATQLGLSPVSPRRRWATPIAAALGLLLGLALAAVALRPKPVPPPAIRNLSFSGQDWSPTPSPDGKVVAFVSLRDGKQRIWVKQLSGGGEAPLTSGPDDNPRFSPDGSALLFERFERGSTWVYRTALLGGDPKRLFQGRDADWSPDARQIAFVRNLEQEGTDRPGVFLANADGGDVRALTTLAALLAQLRWSPDGKRLIAITRRTGLTSENESFLLIDAVSGKTEEVRPAVGGGVISGTVWVGPDEIFYSRAESVGSTMISAGSARIVRQNLRTGESELVCWLPSPSSRVEVLGEGRLLFDQRSVRQNLWVQPLGKAGERGFWLSRGSSLDRQPVFSPDGEWVAFTSNRSGSLDVWAVSTRGGTVRRLTDHAADDWDPGFTPDGQHLIWSSHRGDNFEIWIADPDGSAARQLSRDGVDAENPTAGPDGWVVYNSGNPKHRGLWKVRVDGSQAAQVVPGITNWPEVSLDGRHVLYTGPGTIGTAVHVVRLSDGAKVATIPVQGGPGRARWLPDGKAIAFTDLEPDGRQSLFAQDFAPGSDTSSTRRLLAAPEEGGIETFGFRRDGGAIVYSAMDNRFDVVTADGVPGARRPAR